MDDMEIECFSEILDVNKYHQQSVNNDAEHRGHGGEGKGLGMPEETTRIIIHIVAVTGLTGESGGQNFVLRTSVCPL